MPETRLATFGAGCFWGVEEMFHRVEGVVDTAVGYMGGTFTNPTYEMVCSDMTGHAEVVQVKYDPRRVSYRDLLEVYWQIHDPTTLNRQGFDVGTQYRSVIFYYDDEQRIEAAALKEKLNKSGVFGRPIVTQIKPAGEFYRAEEYHQRYYDKHPEAELGHAEWPAAAAAK